jgi:hypothetical protein
MPMKFIFVIALGLLLSVNVTTQQSAPKAPWVLDSIDAIPISIPAEVRRTVPPDLEYRDSDIIRGVLFDLNGDGTDDYIIQSAPGLCGTGGCPYLIVDGAKRKGLGQVFGNPLYVHSERTRGYLVIETYSHQGAESGEDTIYSFDGNAYVPQSQRLLEGSAVDDLFTALSRIPRWRPRPDSGRGSPAR